MIIFPAAILDRYCCTFSEIMRLRHILESLFLKTLFYCRVFNPFKRIDWQSGIFSEICKVIEKMKQPLTDIEAWIIRTFILEFYAKIIVSKTVFKLCGISSIQFLLLCCYVIKIIQCCCIIVLIFSNDKNAIS